jgi:hypothetical protein
MLSAMSITRRALLGWVAATGLVGGDAFAGKKKPKPLPPLSLNIAVAELDGKPVVTKKWVERQIAEAQRLMKPHRVNVGLVRWRDLDEKWAKLETADDRDALASELEPKAINAFIVESLRDIDKPDRFIRGVRWRNRKNLRKDYVIVSSIAGPFTLCHELGHFLGNGHSYVVNNVMSYKHEDYDEIRFDDRQGAKMRLVARRLLRAKKVLSVDDFRRAQQKAD